MTRVVHYIAVLVAVVTAVATGFLALKVHEREKLMARLIDDAVPSRAGLDTTDVVLALSDRIYRTTNHGVAADALPWYDRWEATSPFNVSSGVSLKYGTFGVVGHMPYGPCGTMSRTLLNALWAIDLPARKLIVRGTTPGASSHTMVEFWDDGKWRVVSPADSTFTWRTRDGEIATVEEIAADPAVFGQVLRFKPYYPYRFAGASHVRWEKLSGPLQRVVRFVLGERRYREATTPSLYDMPRHLLLLLVACLFVIALALVWITRPRRRVPVLMLPARWLTRPKEIRATLDA